MYKAVIDSEVTYFFVDDGKDEIDSTTKIEGYLMNDENIINIVNSMPINQFYVQHPITKITKEQAISLYQKILDNKDQNLKK